MPNANIARGLIPFKSAFNAYETGGMNVYSVPATDGNNYFIGDPMVPTGASDAFGVPVVTRATAGSANNTVGPIVAIAQDPNGLFTITRDLPTYRQASVANYVLIADDPTWMFVIQEDGAMTVATVGMKNANLVAGTGSTVTGYSGWQLQSSSIAVGATLQLRVMRLLPQADNATGTNAKWLVKINTHSLGPAIAGV